MVLSYNNLARTGPRPTGVTGWTQLDSVTADTMGTVAVDQGRRAGRPRARRSRAAERQRQVHADPRRLHGRAPTSASVPFAQLELRDDDQLAAYAGRQRRRWAPGWCRTGPTSPAPRPRGRPPASVTRGASACGADGGRICSRSPTPATRCRPAPYGNIAASTNAPSDMATMWSFVLRPRRTARRPTSHPTAAFSSDCTLLDCDFDSSGSADPDGTIASYAGTSATATPSTEPTRRTRSRAAGTYDVTLTVTDDDGDPTSSPAPSTSQARRPTSPVAFVGSAAAAGNTQRADGHRARGGRRRRSAAAGAELQQPGPHLSARPPA